MLYCDVKFCVKLQGSTVCCKFVQIFYNDVKLEGSVVWRKIVWYYYYVLLFNLYCVVKLEGSVICCRVLCYDVK